MTGCDVRYSQFSPDALLETVRRVYDLPSGGKCVFFKNGLNDVYKLTFSDETYFLRVSMHGVHPTAAITDEIDALLKLRAVGLSVVEPVMMRGGGYVFEVDAPEGMRQVVIFREVSSSPSGDNNALMKNLGRLTARMHLTLDKSDCKNRRPIDRTMLVDEPTAVISPYLSDQPEQLEFLQKNAPYLWQLAEEKLSEQDGVHGICHGDLQPSNFFFNGDMPTLFDFDCMGRGYLVYDIGVLLANLTFSDNEIYDKPIWQAYIDGYKEIRPMTSEEHDAVFIFAALHMLRVLTFHARLIEQNQGAFYFMTRPHLDTFFGAFRRLGLLAADKVGFTHK